MELTTSGMLEAYYPNLRTELIKILHVKNQEPDAHFMR